MIWVLLIIAALFAFSSMTNAMEDHPRAAFCHGFIAFVSLISAIVLFFYRLYP